MRSTVCQSVRNRRQFVFARCCVRHFEHMQKGWDIRVKNLFELLGLPTPLSLADVPSKKSLQSAFKLQHKLLVQQSRRTMVRHQLDDISLAEMEHIIPHQITPSRAQDLRTLEMHTEALPSQLRSQRKGLSTTIDGVEQKTKLARLIEAYQIVSNPEALSRFWAVDDPSAEGALGILLSARSFVQYDSVTESPCIVDSTAGHHLISPAAAVDYSQAVLANLSNRSVESSSEAMKAVSHVTSNTPLLEKRQTLKPQEGDSVKFFLRLTLLEAAHGCTKIIEYKKTFSCLRCDGSGVQNISRKLPPCRQCNGKGMLVLRNENFSSELHCQCCDGTGTSAPPRCGKCQGTGKDMYPSVQRATVHVPIGLRNMESFSLRGMGHDGTKGGRPGDLMLTVLIAEDRHFHRRGSDLHIALPISLSTALLGGIVDVRLLRGGVKQVRVPPHTESGHMLIVRGEGMRYADSSTNEVAPISSSPSDDNESIRTGNLYVHLIVLIPDGTQFNHKQQTIFKELFNDKIGSEDESPSAPENAKTASNSNDGKDARENTHREGLPPTEQDVGMDDPLSTFNSQFAKCKEHFKWMFQSAKKTMPGSTI